MRRKEKEKVVTTPQQQFDADLVADKAASKAFNKFREEQVREAEEKSQRESRVLKVRLAGQGYDDFPGDAVYWVDNAGDLHVYGARGVREVLGWYGGRDRYPYYEDPLGHFAKGSWTSVRYIQKEN